MEIIVEENTVIVETEIVTPLVVPGGAQGSRATINIGEVTTLEPGTPATVENVGDVGDAIFDFGIPKGAKGDKGDSPLVEYSADGITWHTTYAQTDLYIHFSIENGTAWGDTISLAVYTVTWLGSGD